MVPQGPTSGNQALTHSSSFDDGTALTAAPEVAAALAKLLRHDVRDWASQGMTERKHRTVRRVYAGVLDETNVHLKVFRANTIAAKARDALRPQHKGVREAQNLQAAREAGLPAVQPLAYGLARDDGQLCSFIATRSVDAAPFTFPCDDAVAAAAGALVRRVHDAGLQPADLHPGNLLVTPTGDATLCDLTSLHRVGEMSLRRRAEGLAFFCNPIDGGPLDPTTRAFLSGYLAAGPMPDGMPAELARAARRLRAKSLRSFGRRSTRSCRHTDAEPRRRAKPRWFWFVGDHGADDAIRAATAAFDPSRQSAKRTGRRGGVWLCDGYAVKDRLAGKSKKLWLAHYWLLFARVPTATPLALQVHAGRGRVFARRLAHQDLAAELRDGQLSEREIAQASWALGAAVGRLHGHGLRNRDLKFDNLVRDPERGTVAMVDLDGVTLHSAEDTRGCGRDLGRLLAAWRKADEPGGPPTLRRFLYAYLRARRRLLQQPPMRRITAHAARRADEWRKHHD